VDGRNVMALRGHSLSPSINIFLVIIVLVVFSGCHQISDTSIEKEWPDVILGEASPFDGGDGAGGLEAPPEESFEPGGQTAPECEAIRERCAQIEAEYSDERMESIYSEKLEAAGSRLSVLPVIDVVAAGMVTVETNQAKPPADRMTIEELGHHNRKMLDAMLKVCMGNGNPSPSCVENNPTHKKVTLEGAVIRFPAGNYAISNAHYHSFTSNSYMKVRNIHLQLDDGAVIRVVKDCASDYNTAFTFQGSGNPGDGRISLIGGKIIGDKAACCTKDLEENFINCRCRPGERKCYNHCVAFMGVDDLLIRGTEFTGCHGDGIYIGPVGTRSSTDVVVLDVASRFNNRNGMSVVACERCFFNGEFSNTGDANPGCGIDIEPNPGEGKVDDMIFYKPLTKDNLRHGIMLQLLHMKDTGEDVDVVIYRHTDDGSQTAVCNRCLPAGIGGEYVILKPVWKNSRRSAFSGQHSQASALHTYIIDPTIIDHGSEEAIGIHGAPIAIYREAPYVGGSGDRSESDKIGGVTISGLKISHSSGSGPGDHVLYVEDRFLLDEKPRRVASVNFIDAIEMSPNYERVLFKNEGDDICVAEDDVSVVVE